MNSAAFLASAGHFTPLRSFRYALQRPSLGQSIRSHKVPVACTNVKFTSRRAFISRIIALSFPVAIVQNSTVREVYAYSSPYSQIPAADKDLPERLYDSKGVVKTASGLRYFDLIDGDTTKPAVKDGSSVACAYTTRLGGLNGIKLDSSAEHDEEFRFTVGDKSVIAGVNEMVVGMHPGGKRRAVLQPELAYTNANLQPTVKDFFAKRRLLSVLNTNRDATIVIDLELLRIK